jgi:hypothetical protein
MFPGQGARVSLACAADGTTRTEVSDQDGAFRFLNVPVDTCSIQADVQGFVAPPVTVVTAADQIVGSDLHLGIAPLRVGVNVGGTVPSDELKSLRRSCRTDAGRRLERSAKGRTRWLGASRWSSWKRVVVMSHRTIERVIGRLLTDEELRLQFTRSPRGTLAELREQGWELSRLEVDALLTMEVRLWSDVAARIDPRLQRCSLKNLDEERER